MKTNTLETRSRGIPPPSRRVIRIIRWAIGLMVLYCIGYMFVRYDRMALQDADISMAPTIPGGKSILIDTFAGTPGDPYEVGQIVLYRADHENRSVLRLGRIEAVGGELLVEKDEILFANERSLEATSGEALPLGEAVADGSYVILVDNPDLRLYPDRGYPDSRTFGPIPREHILGRYIFTFPRF